MLLFFAGSIASSNVRSGLRRNNGERDIAQSDDLMAKFVGSDEVIIAPPIVPDTEEEPKSPVSDLIEDVSIVAESMESMPCGNTAEICSAVKPDEESIRKSMTGLSFRRCVQIALSACIMCLCSRIIPHMIRNKGTKTVSDGSAFSPIRFHAEFVNSGDFDSRDSLLAQSIFEAQIVPSVFSRLSRLVKVKREKRGDFFRRIRVRANDYHSHDVISDCGNDYPESLVKEGVPGVDAIVVFTYTDCEEDVLMYAKVCEIDKVSFRPVVGTINFCRSSVLEFSDPSDPLNAGNIEKLLIHELVHFLGFSDRMVRFFPSVVKESDSKLYTCQIGEDSKPVVKWDPPFSEVRNMPELHWHFFKNGIVDAIDARGLKAADCRCPLDPDRTYTNEDIEYCIENPNHCAVAVVSENVKQKTREYFGCETAQGMEVEIEQLDPCSIPKYTSHWKTGIDKDELLHRYFAYSYSYLAPYTLAFLQDSGWYDIDYETDRVLRQHAEKQGCENLGL